MEFKYDLPNQQNEREPHSLNLSPEATAALAKKAMGGIGTAEDLLGNLEDTETEKLRDNIENQWANSLAATSTIIEQINTGRKPNKNIQIPTPEEFQDKLDIKLEEWEANGSLEWCNKYIERYGGSMVLVATPNALTNPQEIIKLAKNFGEGQPAKTIVSENFYNRYKANDLSGFLHADQLGLSLIPTAIEKLDRAGVEQQRTELKALQATNPNLKVPSVLDTLTYWQTLRAGGDKLNDNEAYFRTYTRFIDLQSKRFFKVSSVPDSYLDDRGQPCLDGSSFHSHQCVRWAVG